MCSGAGYYSDICCAHSHHVPFPPPCATFSMARIRAAIMAIQFSVVCLVTFITFTVFRWVGAPGSIS